MVPPWRWSLTRNGALTHGSDESEIHARMTTTDTFKDIEKLETDLWEAADNLRANSKLTSSDYFMPVLGVIFLRHAANRLALPSGDQVRMNSVLAGKLRYRQLATDRFHSHLRLELSRKPSARRHRRSSFSGLDPP